MSMNPLEYGYDSAMRKFQLGRKSLYNLMYRNSRTVGHNQGGCGMNQLRLLLKVRVETIQSWINMGALEANRVQYGSKDDQTSFAIHAGDSPGDGSWPNYDQDSDTEIDLLNEISLHLSTEQVAVLMEAGAEKLRYITGSALAVNHLGRVVEVSLSDIYREAAETSKLRKARFRWPSTERSL
jgi:hypothetical protein